MEAHRPVALVVDDDREVLSALARLLGREFRVHLASSSEAALSVLSREPVDVILSDYDLGHAENGLDLLSFVERSQPATRRVLVSATPPVDGDRCAHLVVPKPWSLDLPERVASLLGPDRGSAPAIQAAAARDPTA